jgi:hypothetical protein
VQRTKVAAALVALLVGALTLVQDGRVAAETVAVRVLLSRLTVTTETNSGTYSRKAFKHWIDADRDCEDTRAEVLIRESTTTVGGKCSIKTGTWTSMYDGLVVTTASRLDVDHIVPLKEAWESGAATWSSEVRTKYANDLDFGWSLVAVSASSNRSKSDRDPAEWRPSQNGCEYLQRWVAVKYRWALTIDPAESVVLTSGLAGSCGDAVVDVPVAVATPSVSTTSTTTSTAATSPTVVSTTTALSTTTTTTTAASSGSGGTVSGTVTPGAFCLPAGATGYSSKGVLYTCKTSATDSRNRWRQ